MKNKLISVLAAGAVLVSTPMLAHAEYEYNYNNSNELQVISKDHVAYLYFTYDANGNLIEVARCQNPKNLTSSYVAGTGLILNWDPVPGAKFYRVYVNGSPIAQTFSNSTATLSQIASACSSMYDFSVKAVFGDGVSESGASNKVSYLPAPSFSNAGSVTARTATLSWNNVDGATGYHVYVDGVLAQDTTEQTITLQQLTPDQQHSFEVAAFNTENEGLHASQVLKTMSVPVVTTSNLSTSGVTLNWNPLPNATAYNVYLNGNQVATNVSTNSYQYVGTLDSTASNSFKVSAIYATNEGELSDPAVILPATTITHNAVTYDSITVDWNAVEGATGYSITLIPTSGTPVTQTVTGTSATFSNLSINSHYTVTVSPRSGANSGFPCDPYSVSTATFTASPPTGLKATPEYYSTLAMYKGNMDISWNRSSNADAISYYTLYALRASGQIESTLATNITGTKVTIPVPAGASALIGVTVTTKGVQSRMSTPITFTAPS